MAKLNLNKFAGMFRSENFEVEGFSIEFAPEELPAILKAAMPIINMVKEAADSANARETENLCNKLNDANEKLHEAVLRANGFEQKNEFLEKKCERLIDDKEALKKENSELRKENEARKAGLNPCKEF